MKATFSVKTWFRESTQEWIGEIDYEISHESESGTIRITADSEDEAYIFAIEELRRFERVS